MMRSLTVQRLEICRRHSQMCHEAQLSNNTNNILTNIQISVDLSPTNQPTNHCCWLCVWSGFQWTVKGKTGNNTTQLQMVKKMMDGQKVVTMTKMKTTSIVPKKVVVDGVYPISCNFQDMVCYRSKLCMFYTPNSGTSLSDST